MNEEKNIYLKYNKSVSEYLKLKNAYDNLSFRYRQQQNNLQNIIEKETISRTKKLEKEYKKEISEKNKIIKNKDEEIEALKKELAKAHSIINNNSTNSGIPTSKTAIGQKKHIPNTREKTDKNIGGQQGHKKHKLSAFKDEEITEFVDVTQEKCPKCGSKEIKELEEKIEKCETDYEIKVIKRKYRFKCYECKNCKNIFHAKIPNDLKEENQYGKTLQSLAICLTNEIYTPFNKTVKLISGMTNEEINMSEGYVAKLQKRASGNLEKFIEELKQYFPEQKVYGWDDGVIKINKKDKTIRTYCTNDVALFIAHDKKDKDGIDDDGILNKTTSNTIVMHDHLLVNYNNEYNFKNVECVIHLIRRLKKMEEKTKHKWESDLISFVSKINKERNKKISSEQYFTKKEIKEIKDEYDKILEAGEKENKNDNDNYFKGEEKNFIDDLKKYKKNYLLWVDIEGIPSTNNNSERNIRPVKSKMKISGQFRNMKYAEYYATIRSYIETCKKNGINIIFACVRLMEGNPFSLEEILNYKKTTE